MGKIKNLDEWSKIQYTLCNYFQICDCQRKLKTIIDNLVSIHDKCLGAFEGTHDRDFTGAEWLIIAILDRNSKAISHGINCEYPMVNKDDDLWKWVMEVKDSPYLEDG